MRTVGRYEMLREIGRGGMAIVYAARQPDLDRQVALVPRGSVRDRPRGQRASKPAGRQITLAADELIASGEHIVRVARRDV